MSRIKISNQQIQNLKINHSAVIQTTYTSSTGMTKSKVKQLVKAFQEKYKHKNIQLMVSINTELGFRSGKQFSVNSECILPDDYDEYWNTTDAFVIYSWTPKPSKGGNDLHNDCLYNCIHDIIGTYKTPQNRKTPEDLKAFLNLQRNDKIDISYIPHIEDFYKINISVNGDYSFVSPRKYKMNAPLLLIDGHYRVDEENLVFYSLLNNIPKRTQTLVVCKKMDEKVLCYDGDYFEMSYTDYKKETQNLLFNERVFINKLEQGKDLKETYEFIMEETEILKTLTNGKIDLSRSGFKPINEALKTLHYQLMCFNIPEEITREEQFWIHNAFMGGLIFSEPTILDDAISYDVNSMYPSLMANNNFTFPIKQGEFKQIQELPNILSYGIYRVRIDAEDGNSKKKLFRFNNNDYYTHYDIQIARDLGFTITLIQDHQANALLYTNGRANGKAYFYKVVEELYKLKNQSKMAKRILNSMWGGLSQRNKIKKITIDEVDLNGDVDIIDIRPCGKYHKIEYVRQQKYFKYAYARLGVFLTSYARMKMSKVILPYHEHVYRIHTDGVLLDRNIPLPIGLKMGEWKIEKTGKCVIHHANLIEWGKIDLKTFK